MALVRRAPSPMSPADRLDPFGQLEELQAVTQQIMNNMWSGTGDGNGAPWAPPVDISETDEGWTIEADLPGAEQDDVNVDVQGRELTISGEIKERERKGILRRRARRVGHFEYRVTLPGEIDAEHIDADMKRGVLSVHVPKAAGARSRHIEVSAD
jgi:HSP20 family protein